MRQLMGNDVFRAGLFGSIEWMNQRPATQVGDPVVNIGQAKHLTRDIGPIDVTLDGCPGCLIACDDEGPF
jgi:hypothetical protein